MVIRFLLMLVLASTTMGCGCELYQTTAEGRGGAFRQTAPEEETKLKLSYSTRYNRGFIDVSGLGAWYMGIFLSESGDLGSPGIFFSLDLAPEVGSTQRGGEATVFYPMTLVERAGVGAETAVGGRLELDGSIVEFSAIEVTTIDKAPPTFDVVLTGADESNETWKAELRVVTGRSGRNPNCD